MISTSQKEHLTYTLVSQVALFLGAGALIFYYILPGLETIDTNLVAANTAIDAYTSVEKNGMTYANLGTKLAKKPEYAELVKIIQADPKGAEAAIKGEDEKHKKTPTESYMPWIKDAINANSDAKEALALQKARLNSILPNLSPISGNNNEDYITLKKYIEFIEGSILKKFNFNTTTNVGMQSITFGNATNKMPTSVGMFEFRLDFEATNGDIIDFIQYVNMAGEPKLLQIDDGSGTTATGAINLALDTRKPTIMENPLITISNFSLQNPLDANNRTGENSGRVSINFYVRGGSKDDITFLKENIKARQTALEKSISDSSKACQNNTILCASYQKRLDAFALKYAQFSRTTGVVGVTLDDINLLAGRASTIQALETEFNNILPKSK